MSEPVSGASTMIDLVTATHETFGPFIGEVFEVETEQGPVSLTLDNVKIFEGSGVRDNHLEIDGRVYPPRKAFALTFVGPLEPVLAPQVHAIQAATAGRLELFLSPFRRDRDCMLYESVFN
ncbi:MAG: hypothetical protein GC150_11610 [Rhizobiales bacterium]|nr:hypothetical protein [Hyphomicrobiales bacterium]